MVVVEWTIVLAGRVGLDPPGADFAPDEPQPAATSVPTKQARTIVRRRTDQIRVALGR